jgi:hypothetical protein
LVQELVQEDVPWDGTEETWTMPKHRFTTEAIIHNLREADVLIGQGHTVAQATKHI